MRTGMDLGGLLMVVVAVLASVSASSFPGIPLRPDTHRRVVVPGRALSQVVSHWIRRFNCLE